MGGKAFMVDTNNRGDACEDQSPFHFMALLYIHIKLDMDFKKGASRRRAE